MVIYATIVLTVQTVLAYLSYKEIGKVALLAAIVDFAVVLPIFGRVFGWW